MKKKEPVKPHAESLRKKAIEPVKKKSKGINPVHSEADVLKLIHELEVHKIELELQNEETKKRADELLIANENLTKVEHHLRGRNKELQALYALSQLAEGTELSMESLFRKVLYILINAWQHPEFICSRIVVDGVAYCSENFAPTKWKQSAPVIVSGNIIGSMDVLYMKKMKKEDEGPFLKEERNLINALAERLGHIIEHKRADEKKRNDDTLIRTLSTAIEQSTVTTVITDIEGNIEFVNPMFTEVTGYTFEEAAGRNHRMLKSGNKSKEDYKKLWDTILSGKNWRGEFLNKKKNGDLYYESAVISPVKSEDGSIIRFMALKVDITERKKTEEEIKRQSALITSLIDAIPDVVFFRDKDGVYIAANPAFEELIGMPKRKFIGKTDNDFFDKDIADALRINDIKTMEQNAPHRYEEVISFKDREDVSFETIKTPYRDGNGNIVGILGISRDITERKEAENEIRRQSALIGSLIDSIPDMIFFKDTEGVYLGCNPVFQEFVGKTKDEIIGKTDYDFVDKETADFFRHHDKFMLTENQTLRNEDLVTNADGRKVILDTLKSPYRDGNGNLVGILGISRDITERKEAETKLRESEERFETLAEHSKVITWEIDENGLYTYISDVCRTVLGYNPEEIIGKKHFYDLHPEEGRETFKSEVFGLLMQKKLVRGHINALENKEGNVVWVSTNALPTFFSDGKLMGCRGTDTDITERKEAETKLRESEERYETIAKYSRVITWEVDANGLYTYISDVCKSVLGYSPEEITGKKHFYDIHPEEGREAFKELTLSGMRRHELFRDYENPLQARNGEIIWVSSNGIPVFDDNGTLIRYKGTDTDITERKNMEDELKFTTARLKMAVKIGDIGVWDYNLLTNTINVLDEDMYSIYGTTKDVLGIDYETWKSSLHSDDREFVETEIKKAVKGEKELNTEFRAVWPDGTVHYIRALAVVQRNSSGNPVNMLGTNWDITEQKQKEDQIKQKNEELRELNSEKDKFFSIIAHDLRGPFNGFLGLTDIFASELSTMNLDDIQHLAQLLKESANNLSRFLENLLEWSQMNSGLKTANRKQLLIKNIINDNILLIKNHAANKEIKISTDVQEDMTVFADKYMLETVLRNLLSNAVKYTKKGGSITVSARNTTDKLIEVSVTDTGIGMNKEMIHDLFRIDAKTSRKGTDGESSTGLGLLICREFIEKNEGILTVDSKEGKGSTFRVSLPSCEEIPTTERLKPEKNNEGKLSNLKILIAEDDRVSAKLLSRELYNMSKEMFTAESGVEAVEICRSNPDIDVVIMDIRMPLMDGYEAAKKIREYNKDIVIIAKVTFALSDHAKKAKESGFNDTIINIFDIQLLEETIAKHIR